MVLGGQQPHSPLTLSPDYQGKASLKERGMKDFGHIMKIHKIWQCSFSVLYRSFNPRMQFFPSPPGSPVKVTHAYASTLGSISHHHLGCPCSVASLLLSPLSRAHPLKCAASHRRWATHPLLLPGPGTQRTALHAHCPSMEWTNGSFSSMPL